MAKQRLRIASPKAGALPLRYSPDFFWGLTWVGFRPFGPDHSPAQRFERTHFETSVSEKQPMQSVGDLERVVDGSGHGSRYSRPVRHRSSSPSDPKGPERMLAFSLCGIRTLPKQAAAVSMGHAPKPHSR
jgi:hypothetical protein